MVENSLLDAYRKYNILRKRLYEGQYHEKLKKRLEFYEQEGMEEEYDEVYLAIQQFELLGYELEQAFVKPGKSIYSPSSEFTWEHYFKNADQLLYNQPFVNDFSGREYWQTTNNLLLAEVVKELNKKFPSERWELGEIPLSHWRILNYPGYEPSEYEIACWENSPNIHKELGYYYESSSKPTRCLYQAAVGEEAKKEQSDLSKLISIENKARENRTIYIIDREDDECSGGYDLGLEVEFKENATETFYGTELTPQEQVINSTIVREIDTRLVGSKDMAIVHERLNTIASNLKSFLEKNKFKSSTIEAAPDSEQKNNFGRKN